MKNEFYISFILYFTNPLFSLLSFFTIKFASQVGQPILFYYFLKKAVFKLVYLTIFMRTPPQCFQQFYILRASSDDGFGIDLLFLC
jgi:hypothetical protein